MSLPTLLTFAKVSRETRILVHTFIRQMYDIELQLQEFFTPLEASMFRLLQRNSGLLISGSFALRFFSGQNFGPESDMDIYVEDRYEPRVLDWLCSIGYVCTKRAASYQDRNIAALRMRQRVLFGDRAPNLGGGYVRGMAANNIGRMAGNQGRRAAHNIGPNLRGMGHNRQPNNLRGIGPNLRRVYNMERRGRKIQLIVTHGSSVGIILEYHSTCVMNIISHDHAYCLYPKATLLQKRSLVIYRPGFAEHHSQDALDKYRRRGWTMVVSPEREDYALSTSAFRIGNRHIGDNLCWTIPLGRPSTASDDLIEANSWTLCQSELRLGRLLHAHRSLRLESLRFSYVANARTKHQANLLFGRKRSYGEEPLCFKDRDFRRLVEMLNE
ncbi:hypothetical protein CVT24_012190 [Panaeolus cyanescens]|uniref:Uncharacterized protein n=1 Tax=Panaeolus cyanescens TaxID=181874 RepID=A0A409W4C9_9AGAR|nr:hypothetical protein CVT24_012190 [Panaeolus cyanescens]